MRPQYSAQNPEQRKLSPRNLKILYHKYEEDDHNSLLEVPPISAMNSKYGKKHNSSGKAIVGADDFLQLAKQLTGMSLQEAFTYVYIIYYQRVSSNSKIAQHYKNIQHGHRTIILYNLQKSLSNIAKSYSIHIGGNINQFIMSTTSVGSTVTQYPRNNYIITIEYPLNNTFRIYVKIGTRTAHGMTYTTYTQTINPYTIIGEDFFTDKYKRKP